VIIILFPLDVFRKFSSNFSKMLHGIESIRQPLWCSGQEFLATDSEVPRLNPGAIDFLGSIGSGTRSNQPHEYN
jgi:hypothetical protein